MPSNLIKINEAITYEVPDSFMPPLMAYLKMVKQKTRIKEKKGKQREGTKHEQKRKNQRKQRNKRRGK
ncbi:hypothetical protein LCGC14_1976360 [marine sediment metagenome]|uniref:Uncharacterized protein n=1 Tax=marine sediment metagenome TaxID=412755 RepID=A0A0F9FAP6_9ZZZZ